MIRRIPTRLSYGFTRPVLSLTSRTLSTTSPEKGRYYWVEEEAQELITKAYQRHLALQGHEASFPPSLSVSDLEHKFDTPIHFSPENMGDKAALGLMKFLRVFTHGFFREKYNHHAVVLETVAAVPGFVAAFHRHLRSLRTMKRDNNWINPLQEEAENERMHLLIWMQVTQPTRLERFLVMLAQGTYLGFYTGLYFISPKSCHRLVGYLEEEAFLAYTDYLKAIDDGRIKNGPAPNIAKKYYRLADDATIRDVVLHVRADEAMHRDFNHMIANKYASNDLDSPLIPPGKLDAIRDEAAAQTKRQ